MVDRIGQSGSMAREAILAALKSQSKAADGVRDAARQIETAMSGGAEKPQGAGFGEQLEQGIKAVNEEIGKAESLPEDLVTGKVDDLTEVAVQMKKAELSFRYTMEVRNKLIDAYREVMRMNV